MSQTVQIGEISFRNILVIAVLENKLFKNMLSSSYLLSNRGKILLTPDLLHTYGRLLKVVGNMMSTLAIIPLRIIWYSSRFLESSISFIGTHLPYPM
jgi:hypothetical protein